MASAWLASTGAMLQTSELSPFKQSLYHEFITELVSQKILKSGSFVSKQDFARQWKSEHYKRWILSFGN